MLIGHGVGVAENNGIVVLVLGTGLQLKVSLPIYNDLLFRCREEHRIDLDSVA